MVGIMTNLSRLSGSRLAVLLVIIATSVTADDRSLKDYDKKLNQVIETYTKTCGTTEILADLATLFKPNASNVAKECEPKKIESSIRSLLSETNDITRSDLEYRNWYNQWINRIGSIFNVQNPHSSSFSQKKIDIRSVSSSTIKGPDEDSKTKIVTPKGFRTISGD